MVLLWFFLSCVQLQRADDQLAVMDMQLLNKGNMKRSALEQTHHHDGEFTELRELKDVITQLREQLQSSQSQIEELKKQNAGKSNDLNRHTIKFILFHIVLHCFMLFMMFY